MKYFRKILAILIALPFLAGCLPIPARVPAQTAAATPNVPMSQVPALTGDWRLTLSQSGGIVGLSRQVEITSAGDVTLTDLRSNKSSQSHLSAADLDSLIKLVAASRYLPSNEPSTCADCFIYDLQISSGGQNFTAHFDQTNLAGSGLKPLVDFLAPFLIGPVQ